MPLPTEWNTGLNTLSELGVKRGFVTYDEINSHLPSAQIAEPELYDELIAYFENDNISVIEASIAIEKNDIDETDELTDKEIALIEGSPVEDSMSLWMKQVGRKRLLSKYEELHLAERVSQDDDTARNILTESNLRLVISIAKRYRGRGLSFADLIQEGNTGLLHAASKYKYQKECRFSTYATWWIKHTIIRALANQGRTIRLPAHVMDDLNELARTSSRLAQTYGREPTDFELADEMGISLDQIQEIKRVAPEPMSIFAVSDGEETVDITDFITDVNAEIPSDIADKSFVKERLTEMMSVLSEREQEVLNLRFGFKDGNSYTLDEVGKHLNVTRERVRQIESKALMKLRHPRRSKRISDINND